jgi:hypothetical protein
MSNLPDDTSSDEALQMMFHDPTHLYSEGRTVPFTVFPYILGYGTPNNRRSPLSRKPQIPIILYCTNALLPS